MKVKKFLFSSMATVLAACMMPLSAFAAVDFDTTVSNDYYSVISNKEYALAPGVSESEIIVNNSVGSDRKIVHVLEVDATDETVKVLPGYYGIDKLDPDNLALDGVEDKSQYWTDKKLTETVAYYEDQLGYNVVGAMNTALAYDSNAPYGYMVWDGVVLGTPEVHKGAQTYLAVYKDGSAELRNMSTPLDGNEWTAISANFGWLVKDGKLTSNSVERTSSDASRSMIGIKEDGTLVFCQVDGRNAPTSTGLSNYEMGEMMLSLGCKNAVNCDGGGSSTFVTKREGETVNTMRSIPSDGAERPTINSVIIASTAIATGIFDHANVESDYDYYAAGSTGEFTAVGLDSAGFVAEIPDGVEFKLSDDTFGTMNGATFTSNGKKGAVDVQMVYNNEVVGARTINVVDPDVFALELDETVLPYGKSMDIEFACTYGADNWAVCMDGAYSFTLSDDSAATIEGNKLTATTDDSKSGVDVVAVYNANTAVTDTLKITFGKGSEIIYDFEDGDVSDWMGFDEAKQYSIDNGVNNTLVGSSPLSGQYSDETDSNTFLATKENGGQVRNGNYALAWNVDNTNAAFASWTYNVLFNVGGPTVLRDVANGKNATSLGMWLYIPEGATGLAFQSQLYAKSSTGEYTCKQAHFTFTTKNGTVKNLNSCTEADIPESRWVYASIDLSGYDFICMPDPADTSNSRSPSVIRTYVKPTAPAVHTFYIDDITLDYSSAVDDRVLPTISDVSYIPFDEAVTLDDNASIAQNTMAFSAAVADNAALDNSTGKIYVDGVAVESATVSGKYLICENVTLTNGVHTVAFEIKDKLGNLAKVTRTFTVGSDALITLGGHNETNAPAEYDSIYYVDINTADITAIDGITATINLQTANNWEVEGMEVADGYKATAEVNEITNNVTVTVKKVRDTGLTGAQTLVSIPVRVWSWDAINHITGEPITPEAQYATGNNPVVTIDYKVVNATIDFADGAYDGYFATFGGKQSVATNINDCVNPWHTHMGNPFIYSQSATCFTDGFSKRTRCTICKSTLDWGTVIPAAHKNVTVLNKEVTCTEDGYENRKVCTDCNTVVEEGTVIEAKGHEIVDMVDYKLYCHCGEAVNDTGLVNYNGDTYYAIAGSVLNGWHNIDGNWHYFRTSTRKAAVGTVTHTFGNVRLNYTYSDANDGRLTSGVWVTLDDGIRYYYGPGYYSHTWATIDGESYYFDSNGYRYTGYNLIKDSRYSHDDDYRLYLFGEDGKLVEKSTGNGIFVTDNGTYYLEDGYAKHKGLVLVNGDYYYFGSSRMAAVGDHYVDKTNGLLDAGTYTFGADGKMVKKNGIVGDYYYIDGVIQKCGLTKVGDDYYYFSTTNGKMRKNQTSQVNFIAPGCDLSIGVYTFGADGKVMFSEKNGIIGDYYYINDVIQMCGLTKVGDDYYYFSTTNGKMRKNQTSQVNFVAPGCDLPIGEYTFGADGKVIIPKRNGIIGDYYYIDDVMQMGGLTKVGDDYYYFSTTNGKMRKNQTSQVNFVATGCDLSYGVYTFGIDGKVVFDNKNGIEGDYYYVNGLVQMGGLTKVGNDYYYFSTTNGKMRRSQTSQVNHIAPGCDLKTGVYKFGADGKVVF